MQGYRDDGVVLRTQKLGEADRIITLLTRHNGRVRAVAKGIRRTKSRFGGRLEPFTHVDVLVHPGRSLDTITQAEVIRAYGTPLAADYPKYTAGTAMLETAERFTPVEKEPAIRQFLLLIGGLRALGEAVDPGQAADDPGQAADDLGQAADDLGQATDDRDPAGLNPPADSRFADPSSSSSSSVTPTSVTPTSVTPTSAASASAASASVTPTSVVPLAPMDAEASDDPVSLANPGTPRDPRMVLDAYFLRSLTFAGYAPALEECARCGAPARTGSSESLASARPLVAFAIAAGGMVCAEDRPPGAASPAPQTVALMIALLRGDWTSAMRSERRHRVECSGLVAAYLQWHLEHSIRSLRHVERA